MRGYRMLASVLALVLAIQPGGFTTERLYQAALSSPDCLDYCLVGVCFWLRCSPLCSVETTLRASHQVPDLVVASYNQVGQNPWREANLISTAIGGGIARAIGLSGGHADTDAVPLNPFRESETHSLQFSEIDVFGGIGSDFIKFADKLLPICDSPTEFLRPYYLSPLDWFAWRSGLTEQQYTATYIPGWREIGNWGPVHPRMGSLIQAEEPKACAVFAQRAADIVTRRRQPHVYTPSGGPSTDERSDQWQAIFPWIGSRCGPFGRDPDYSQGKGGARGIFVWQLWRRYSCCKDNPGAIFLFHVSSPRLCR